MMWSGLCRLANLNKRDLTTNASFGYSFGRPASRNDKPERFSQVIQSWDTANKDNELSDYSVCTTWGVKGKHLYLVDVYRRKLEFPCLPR